MSYLLILIFISFLFILYFSLRHAWWRKNISFKIPRILTYHMICNHLDSKKSKFNRLRVQPEEFERQIKWLKESGWTSFKLTDLIENKNILPEKSIVITIDDGFEDNYVNAFEILKKYDFKATIFPVINRFNHDWATDKDLLESSSELNNERMLSNEQIDEMIQSGLIEIGSHTLNHYDLTKLNKKEKIEEILNSKKIIENLHKIECTSIVYPFGYYDEEVIEIVKESGYKVAASGLIPGYDNLDSDTIFCLKRVLISGRQSFYDFKLKILKGRNR